MTPSAPYWPRLSELRGERITARTDPGRADPVWAYGDADAPTLLVVHGFRGDHHGLEPIVAHLDGFRVLAPDLPGFGEAAPLAGEHSVDGYARWLIALVDALGLEAPAVLGHSFGSIVVARAVALGLDPRAIVLVNPIAAPALGGPKAALTALTLAYYRLAARLPERTGLALLRHPAIVRVMSVIMAKTRLRDLRRWIHGEHDAHFSAFATRGVVLEAFRASVSRDVSADAAALTAPTLLIAAERDDISRPGEVRALADTLPAAEVHVIPGAGHLVHYEAPQTAARLIGAWAPAGRRPR